jgi:transcriptional regulator with XRE-family HTH domain
MAEMVAHLLIAMRDQQLTQQEVADLCGFSQPQVAAYLNGKKEPGIRNLVKLAAAVGCVWRLLPVEQA